MMGNSVLNVTQTMDNRMFVYEISGLNQNDQTVQSVSPIRSSSTVLFPVPFKRMSAFMQRINRLGGTIVAIHSSWETAMKSSAQVSGGDS